MPPLYINSINSYVLLAGVKQKSFANYKASIFRLFMLLPTLFITFHLPFEEMTINPLDFAAITGLSFSGDPVLFSSEAYSSIVCEEEMVEGYV